MPRPYARGHQAQGIFGQCAECFESVVLITSHRRLRSPGKDYYRHARRKQPQTARDRTFCSVCGRKGEWYEFDGSGRGVECQP